MRRTFQTRSFEILELSNGLQRLVRYILLEHIGLPAPGNMVTGEVEWADLYLEMRMSNPGDMLFPFTTLRVHYGEEQDSYIDFLMDENILLIRVDNRRVFRLSLLQETSYTKRDFTLARWWLQDVIEVLEQFIELHSEIRPSECHLAQIGSLFALS